MLLVRSVRGATLHKLHGNISVWSHNFCNTPWIKVGNTTNVKSYLIDRIRPVDLVLLQSLFQHACHPVSARTPFVNVVGVFFLISIIAD